MKVGDWVKYPTNKKSGWAYGRVVVINHTSVGTRVSVDTGYMGLEWFGDGQLDPIDTEQDTTELRDALSKLANK